MLIKLSSFVKKKHKIVIMNFFISFIFYTYYVFRVYNFRKFVDKSY